MKPKREGKERRPLVAGLAPVDPVVEQEFVYADKAKASSAMPSTAAMEKDEREGKGQKAGSISRVPLTTRVRSDFAAALKRASLQRQLDGEFPNTLQDILEEALEPWLRSKGYLT
jgi:hypothetical protein